MADIANESKIKRTRWSNLGLGLDKDSIKNNS